MPQSRALLARRIDALGASSYLRDGTLALKAFPGHSLGVEGGGAGSLAEDGGGPAGGSSPEDGGGPAGGSSPEDGGGPAGGSSPGGGASGFVSSVSSSRTASSIPFRTSSDAFLNSAIPFPRLLARSGRRFGPKKIRTTTRMMSISWNPIPNISRPLFCLSAFTITRVFRQIHVIRMDNRPIRSDDNPLHSFPRAGNHPVFFRAHTGGGTGFEYSKGSFFAMNEAPSFSFQEELT